MDMEDESIIKLQKEFRVAIQDGKQLLKIALAAHNKGNWNADLSSQQSAKKRSLSRRDGSIERENYYRYPNPTCNHKNGKPNFQATPAQQMRLSKKRVKSPTQEID